MPDIPEEVIRPIIFVHGLAGSASQYQTQAMRFASNGYPDDRIVAFEYSTDGLDAVTRAATGGGLTRRLINLLILSGRGSKAIRFIWCVTPSEPGCAASIFPTRNGR